MTDQRALGILFNTYWSSTGWKRGYSISPEDFMVARNAGYMFEPVSLSHDALVAWMEKSEKKADPRKIADSFLASLSSRRLELRSALGSLAISRNFPLHNYQGKGLGCSICGAYDIKDRPCDLSVLNFERYKWGGVRHDHPEYIAFDLEQFGNLESIQPTSQDLEIMAKILIIAGNCDGQARPRDLEKRLKDVFPSNKAEREILIQILSYCGIIQPRNHPGYFQTFPKYSDRSIPPVNKIDWTYPVCWWRGADGINQTAVQYYFPQLTDLK